MKKNITLSLLLLSAIVLAWCTTKTPVITDVPSIETWLQTGNEVATPEVTVKPTVKKVKPIPVVTPPVKETPSGFTLDDVAKHNTKSDCWTAINGNVYNMTSAFGKHPWWDGTLALLCGVEWTKIFNSQHWSSASAKSRLAQLKIWALK